MPTPVHRARRRLGRRGAMLTVLGITYVLVGLGAYVLPVSAARLPELYFALPATVRALLWAISGGVACVFAWRHRDTPGWRALFLVPLFRGGSYVWVAIRQDDPAALYSALLNVPFIAVALICAGWSDRNEPAIEESDRA